MMAGGGVTGIFVGEWRELKGFVPQVKGHRGSVVVLHGLGFVVDRPHPVSGYLKVLLKICAHEF